MDAKAVALPRKEGTKNDTGGLMANFIEPYDSRNMNSEIDARLISDLPDYKA